MGLWDVGAKWLENFVVNRKDAGKITVLEKDKTSLQTENEILQAQKAILETENANLKAKQPETAMIDKEPTQPFEIHSIINAFSHHDSPFVRLAKRLSSKKPPTQPT